MNARFVLKARPHGGLGVASLASGGGQPLLPHRAREPRRPTTSSISPNGRAMAMQQSDGNFCVWGGSPATARPYDASWCHMKINPFLNAAHTKYYTVDPDRREPLHVLRAGRATRPGAAWRTAPRARTMSSLDDHGNLCTHKGTGPQQDWGVLWCTMDTGSAPPLAPNVIDVSAAVADLFNSDANAARSLAQAVGASKPDQFYIESVKITQLQNTAFNFTPPKGVLVPVDTQEIVNCDETQVTRQVDFSTDVTNSVSIAKSKTFDTSVSATVSYSGLFASGSVTATASYSMTDSSESSNSNTTTAHNSTTIRSSRTAGASRSSRC